MAHFLIDARLPRATAALVRVYGHLATDVRDIGLGTAADLDIAEHARLQQLAVISVDQDFGNVLVFPPADYYGLVVIRPPDAATVAALLSLVETLLNEADVVANLAGRLVVVAPGRIRCRPPI